METEKSIDIEKAAKALETLGAELKKAIKKHSYDDVAGAFRKKYPFKLHQLEEFEIIDTIFAITKPSVDTHTLSTDGAMYYMKSDALIELLELGDCATSLRSKLPEQSLKNEALNAVIVDCESIGNDARTHLLERLSEYEFDIKDLTQTLNQRNNGQN
ncbi:hypothetical protein [Gracilimonas tropica]|uniref:hypothetical protein n=1 Tax=Gracilimonas tropica TaxID=454600 RepID=UPI00036C801A|nr:hypothetical protein [Gracilimonas tropica]